MCVQELSDIAPESLSNNNIKKKKKLCRIDVFPVKEWVEKKC